MIGGGLVCDRRHSETTASMKPKRSMPLTRCAIVNNAGTYQGSVPTSLFCAPTSSAVVLKSRKIAPLQTTNKDGSTAPSSLKEENEEIEFSGTCISIGNGKYEVFLILLENMFILNQLVLGHTI
jgi:hypothetical protein